MSNTAPTHQNELPSMTTGVLLDFGGTLIEEISFDEKAATAWLFAKASKVPAGVTIEHVHEKLDELSQEFRSKSQQVQMEVSWLALSRLAYCSLGIEFPAPLEDYEFGYWKTASRMRAMPGAYDALEKLHQRGIPTAVVANCRFSRHVIRSSLSRFDLAKHLSFVMVSSELGVRKPHTAIFESAARRLGVAPQHAWYIGDDLDTDIAGAQAAGMNTIWLRPRDRSVKSEQQPDFTVKQWSEISKLLGRRAA